MPITPMNEYLKLTLGGSAWEDQEIWSIGVHLAMVDGSSVEQALADFDLKGAISAFADNMILENVPSLSSAVQFSEVRLARFNNRGKQQGDSRLAFVSGNPYGFDTAQYLPQHSVVVTLNSDLLRGKTSKGRFYLPPGYGLPSENGYIPTNTVVSTANQAINFLNALSDVATDADPDLRISNVSTYTATFSGAANEVVSVSVGNVIDTQRRRRNGLKERYQSGDLS